MQSQLAHLQFWRAPTIFCSLAPHVRFGRASSIAALGYILCSLDTLALGYN